MRSERKKLKEAARLLARGDLRIPGPNDDRDQPEATVNEAAAALGLRIEGELEIEETFYLWPECLKHFNFYNALGSQWRESPNGRTGLDYTAVEAYMRMNVVPKNERAELIRAVQIMEFAALDEWAQQ